VKPFILRCNRTWLWTVYYISREQGDLANWRTHTWQEAWRYLERRYHAGDVYRIPCAGQTTTRTGK